MRKLFRLLVVVTALSAAFPLARPAAAQRQKDDIITLKDGRVIRGKIIEFFPSDSTFLMRLPDGNFARFNKADVARMDSGAAVRPGEEHYTLKSPALAWFLSFLITGVGQIYNEDVVKGLGIFAIGGAGTLLYLSGSSDECFGESECATKETVGAIILLAAWLGSQIEAPIQASAINREVRSRGRVALGLWPEPHALGVSLVHLSF